jgi:hypothetical protein
MIHVKRSANIGLLVLCLWCCQSAEAQHQRDHFYLHNGLMLGFTEPEPHLDSLPNGLLPPSSWRVTSDPRTGSVLFITDGKTVYNRDFLPMKNGASIGGEVNDVLRNHTQQVWSCPVPGDDSDWFVFAAFLEEPFIGLFQTRVNMRGDSGRGEVVQKNIEHTWRPFRSMTIVNHSDEYHYWLVVGSAYFDTCYSYLIGPSGIEGPPVTSNVPVPRDRRAPFVLIASKSGTEIADFNSIYHFDRSTGRLNLWRSFYSSGLEQFNSMALSPSGRYEYISEGQLGGTGLLQYDLLSSSEEAIYDSSIVLRSIKADGGADEITTLVLGPDNRIYGPHSFVLDKHIICSIDSPDVHGNGCGFRDTALLWGEKPSAGFLVDGVVSRTNSSRTPQIAATPLEGCEACYSFRVQDSISDYPQWSFEGGTPATATGSHVDRVCFDSVGPHLIQAVTRQGDTLSTLAFGYAEAGIASPVEVFSTTATSGGTVDVPVTAVLTYPVETPIGYLVKEVEIRFDSSVLRFDPSQATAIQLPLNHVLVGITSTAGYLRVKEEDTSYSDWRGRNYPFTDIDTVQFGTLRFQVNSNSNWDQTSVTLSRILAETREGASRFCAPEVSPLARISRMTESVAESPVNSLIALQPNPASASSGTFSLTLKTEQGDPIDVKVFDVMGREVTTARFTGSGNKETFSIHARLVPGNYLVRTSEQQNIETLSFIVLP